MQEQQSPQTYKPQRLFLLVGIYDILLAAGALWSALQMLLGTAALFSDFPTTWYGKLPFESWAPIGFLALFFAAGNAAAAVLCLLSRQKRAVASLVMGVLLTAGMTAQILVLGEEYLATIEFSLLAILQIILSAALLSRQRFVAAATEHGL